jgi:hypothetical protein
MRNSLSRAALAVVLTFSCVALTACDTLDALDWFDTKKKLPGERKPVFPDGVPGIERGIPSEYLHGAGQQPETPAASNEALEQAEQKADAPAKPRAAKPTPKRTVQHAQPKPQPVSSAPPAPAPVADQSQPPPPAGQLRPWPGDSQQAQPQQSGQPQADPLDQRWPQR